SPAVGTLVMIPNDPKVINVTYNLSCTVGAANPAFTGNPAEPGPLAMTGPNGVPQTNPFTVTNTGGAGTLLNVSVYSLTVGYTVTGLPITNLLQGAAGVTVTVGCTPGTSPAAGTLTLTTDDPA